MYEYLKVQNEEMKSEVFELMKRLIEEVNPRDVSNIILQENPLPKLFDVFEEVMKNRRIPVIVLSDSTARREEEEEEDEGSVNANRGGANGDGNYMAEDEDNEG